MWRHRETMTTCQQGERPQEKPTLFLLALCCLPVSVQTIHREHLCHSLDYQLFNLLQSQGGYAGLQHACCNKGSSTKSNKRNPDESHFAAFCGVRAPIVASFRLQVWGPTHCSLTLFRQRWIGKRCPLTHHYVLFPPLSYNRCKKPQRQGLPWWSSGCVAMKISNATTKTWCRQKN